MKRSTQRRLAILAAIVAILVVAVVLFDWNWLRGPIDRYVSNKLGRPFAINGDLRVKLSTSPLIELNQVTLGNASWGAEPQMVTVDRAAFRIALGPLFSGLVVLPEISLDRPQVLLERTGDGQANWIFKTSPGKGAAPAIGNLSIRDGMVRLRDAVSRTDVKLSIATEAQGPQDAEPMMRVAGTGTYRNEPFELKARGGSLLSLRDRDKPYRLAVQAKAVSTQVSFNGTLVDPVRLSGLDGRLEVQGQDLSKLDPIVPAPLPWTPPYRLAGQLVREGEIWSFRQFSGRVGNSDLSGSFSADMSGERPFVTADITSRRLDYKDLGGFVGAPPGRQPAARAPEQKRAAARLEAKDKVLPDKPYSLAGLRKADMDVKFRGERIFAPELPLDNLATHLTLKEGLLRLHPLDFGVANGHVVSDITLDARQDLIRTNADVSVQAVELGRLFPKLKVSKGSAGKFGGRARLETTGNSVAKMLASADGEMALILSGGKASNLMMFLTNLDLANAAAILLKGDEDAPVHCIVVHADAKAGNVVPDVMLMDTAAERITGEGNVNLRDESLDLRLRADSKKASLLALRGPIVIRGTFKNPQVRPAIPPVAARAGAALALGAVLGPLAALLPLIETGGATDANCRALTAEVRQDVAQRDNRDRGRNGKGG